MLDRLSIKTGIPLPSLKGLMAVFQKFPCIEKVTLYGSRAKGNFRPGSDIDLAVSSTTMTYLEQMKLETEIDDLLLPYTIDLLHLEKLTNEKLVEHILRVGILLYEKNDSFATIPDH
jgi:predicted nucleotidyltransferase